MNKYIVSKLNDMMKKKVSFMRGHVSEYLLIFVWISVVLLNMDWVYLLFTKSVITPPNIVAMIGFTCCESSIKYKIA